MVVKNKFRKTLRNTVSKQNERFVIGSSVNKKHRRVRSSSKSQGKYEKLENFLNI